MADDSLFKKFVHVRTGKEFDIGFLRESNYVETLGMDGPKLMMTWDDPNRYIKDVLQVRELDDVEAHLSDDWALDGMNIKLPFTVMMDPSADRFLKFNLMASPVFKLKRLADKTRIFRQRGVPEILQAFSGGLKVEAGRFPIVEDYHCIAGERPSALLRQIAHEQGAHIWLGRDGWQVKTFASLFAAAPAFEYHYGKPGAEFEVISFTRPSQQTQVQEQVVRGYTGWNDVLGRVKAPSSGPVLSKASKYAPVQFSSQNVRTLGNQPTSYRIAVDFMGYGNGFLTPGMVLKLWWHMATPDRPLDESLPDKVVIHSVAHYYSAQKYYCRVKGAVPLEPTA